MKRFPHHPCMVYLPYMDAVGFVSKKGHPNMEGYVTYMEITEMNGAFDVDF